MKNYENFSISQVAKRYFVEESMVLNRLEDDWRGVKLSDSVTANYLNQMKAMADAGIGLAANILNFTTSNHMERLARSIQRGQENLRKGINNELRKRDSHRNSDFENRQYIRESGRILDSTVRDMRKTTPSDKINCAFLKTILPYLDGWNRMIRLARKYEVSPGLRQELSQQSVIIGKQRQQVRGAMSGFRCG